MSSIGKCRTYIVTKPKTANSLLTSSKAITANWTSLKAGSMLRGGRTDWSRSARNTAPSRVTVTRGAA